MNLIKNIKFGIKKSTFSRNKFTADQTFIIKKIFTTKNKMKERKSILLSNINFRKKWMGYKILNIYRFDRNLIIGIFKVFFSSLDINSIKRSLLFQSIFNKPKLAWVTIFPIWRESFSKTRKFRGLFKELEVTSIISRSLFIFLE